MASTLPLPWTGGAIRRPRSISPRTGSWRIPAENAVLVRCVLVEIQAGDPVRRVGDRPIGLRLQRLVHDESTGSPQPFHTRTPSTPSCRSAWLSVSFGELAASSAHSLIKFPIGSQTVFFFRRRCLRATDYDLVFPARGDGSRNSDRRRTRDFGPTVSPEV